MRRLTFAACVVFCAGCAAQYVIDALVSAGGRGKAYIGVHGALSLCMLVAWSASRRAPPDAVCRAWLIGGGVVARVLLVGVAPFTTHDVARYLWDGRAAWEGFDPYRVTPQSAVVRFLAAQWPVAAEHAPYPTLYPPLSVAIFALCAAVGPQWSLWLWKGVACAASVGTLLVGDWVLARLGRQEHLALLALSPLLVLEAGVGAHVDVVVACAVAVALAALLARRFWGAGMALGCGVLLKFSPVVLLVPVVVVFWRQGERMRLAHFLIACSLTVATGYVAALGLGWWPVGSLGIFLRQWRFGSPLAELLAPAPAPDLVAVVLAFVGLGGAVVLTQRRGLWVGLRTALAVPFLVSRIVFPWYLLAWVPIVAVAPAYWAIAWVSTLPLTYEVIDVFDRGGGWHPAAWPLWVTAFGWVVGWWADGRRPLSTVVAR